MMNMQDAKLFRVKDKKMDWQKVKNEFKLINEEVKVDVPEDIHYVFGGMAPISVRLLERFVEKKGFANIGNLLQLLPGRYIRADDKSEKEFFDQSKSINRPKKILVYFLGGVTFAEVAAIRFLNSCDRIRD